MKTSRIVIVAVLLLGLAATIYSAWTKKTDKVADTQKTESHSQHSSGASGPIEGDGVKVKPTESTAADKDTEDSAEPVANPDASLSDKPAKLAPTRADTARDERKVEEQDLQNADSLGSKSSNHDSNANDLVPVLWKLGSSSFSSSVADVIEFRSDYQRVWQGSASVRLRPKRIIDPRATAGIVQVIDAENFTGDRIRYTGYIQTERQSNVESGSAFLWLRADNAAGKLVAFQNTIGRFQLQDSVWQQIEIVIDIPPEASVIFYGASLLGNGSVWVDSLLLENVSTSAPKTSPPDERPIYNRIPSADDVLDAPANLDFEETRTEFNQ